MNRATPGATATGVTMATGKTASRDPGYHGQRHEQQRSTGKGQVALHGVVSLLDAEHTGRVERLWDAIAREFDVRGVYSTPFPHFSYHVAAGYDVDRVGAVLDRAARKMSPLTVRTSGLGIFTGGQPVVYVPVVRDSALTQFHASVWPVIDAHASATVDYYRPDRWMPHITLSFGDVDPERLPGIIGYLNSVDLDWEVRIDNLALILDTGTRQELRFRFAFSHAR